VSRIFLSYRRDDAAAYASRLRDSLASAFGDDSVLTDVQGTVASSDVIVVVIGPRWLEPTAGGRRWVDDPNDLVRLDIAAALTGGIRVIPVLVGGARMPSVDELPPDLSELARRGAVELRDPTWASDTRLLVTALERLVPASAERTLTSMLREAAVAGIVPAAARGTETPAPAPSAGVVYPPAAELPAERPQMKGRYPSPLRIVPLVLLGAGVVFVATKWLFGWFVHAGASAAPSGDTVDCTVFAPPSAAPGDSILVQVFAHLPEQAADAQAIAMELDTDARRRTFQSLEAPVAVGARLQFELRMPGLAVDDPVASLIWRRRAEAVQFGVQIPPNAPEGTVIGTLDVSLDSSPVGHVKFKLAVDRDAAKGRSEPQGERARRYTAAFISYASEDRDEVLARVQMLPLVGIRYFQDLLSLEPGDRWAKRIELGIDECDLFLLFWSSESKRSEWVRKEVRYALDRRGDDELSPPEIRPVIVEGPPIVAPWEELAHLHFNDRLLYFMNPRGS
jgi:hypothetical protein